MHKTIFLAGSGRSGTTWLGNIISANPTIRVVFEPFDRRHVPEAGQLPLRPYARPEGQYPWEGYARRVFAGKVRNEWVDRQGYRWWGRRMLIKEIRANLMLPWLERLFQPQVVFLTRHPCAVVLSRMKLGWDTHLDVFLSQPELVEDYLAPYLDVIRSAQTEVEKHAVMWAVENYIPLQQLPHYGWSFTTYEDMYCDPGQEAQRVLDDLQIARTWFVQRAIHQVTKVTRPDSALHNNRNPLMDWQRKLSAEQVDEVLRVVQAFGIDLYSNDVLPNRERVLALQQSASEQVNVRV